MRKIVQISSSNYVIDGMVDFQLFALCEDGTLWKHNENYQGYESWKRIKSIPQPSEEAQLSKGEEKEVFE